MDKVKVYRYGKYDVMTARMEGANCKATMAFTSATDSKADYSGPRI